jgi:Animal haem peroxidase
VTGRLRRFLSRVADTADRRLGWWRLPTPLALLVLIGLRDQMRRHNLYDTGRGPDNRPPFDVEDQPEVRTLNGTGNDRDNRLVGSMGSRFGRNVPRAHTYPEEPARLLDPNPRLISTRLLTREQFQPATTLNLLAAAWIQFEVHDWMSHGTLDSNPWVIPLADGDPWPDGEKRQPPVSVPGREMHILRTAADPSPDPFGPPTFVNQDTHWWDGSQIYGESPDFAKALRSPHKGKLLIDELGLPPAEVEQHVDLSGVAGNFWVGLAILHSLFMREHNAICERLADEYPRMSDDDLYDKARLVNAALMAKIHTVDWTPAIIANPTTVAAMRANWSGLLGARFRQWFGRVTDSEVLQGIPGSPSNDYEVPYSLTEEFVAVYRMHPLIPDDFVFRCAADDRVIAEHALPDLAVLQVRQRLSELPMADIFYSFGRANPGALTLHNYPKYLHHFNRADRTLIDLAAIDVLRIRERGVPRYNEFRRLFRLKPAASFEELNPACAAELRDIYGDIERVDLMIGLFAESKPPGFGFSDTAFRVFVLMASRRLETDRFFTRDFRPEIYTPAGMEWINANTMRTVLLRHFPTLKPALDGVENPFAPWASVAADSERTF